MHGAPKQKTNLVVYRFSLVYARVVLFRSLTKLIIFYAIKLLSLLYNT